MPHENDNYGLEMSLTDAKDWGRKEYQEELLAYIETAISELDEKDVAGHNYWNTFKNLVLIVKP